MDTNRSRQLVKYPSDPAIFSGYDQANKSNQQQTSSNKTINAINMLNDVLQATDSVLVSSSNTSIQSLATNSISSSFSDISASNTNNNSLVLSTSKENDLSLDAIEMIVKKHFSRTSPTSTKVKKRLVSGPNGKSVTDLDEFALTAIKKKKTNDKKITKKKNNKKITNTQEQNVPSNIHVYNVNDTNTTNITPVGAHIGSLPPITYMLPSNTTAMISPIPSNTSTMISPLSSNVGSYIPLQNLTSMSSRQCQLCFNVIKPLEITSNCNQCHGILCWNCSCKVDKNYQLCHLCQTYYTVHQQTYFNKNQYL